MSHDEAINNPDQNPLLLVQTLELFQQTNTLTNVELKRFTVKLPTPTRAFSSFTRTFSCACGLFMRVHDPNKIYIQEKIREALEVANGNSINNSISGGSSVLTKFKTIKRQTGY